MLFSWYSFGRSLSFLLVLIFLFILRIINSPCNLDLSDASHKSAGLLTTHWRDRSQPFDRRTLAPRPALAWLRCNICQMALINRRSAGKWKRKTNINDAQLKFSHKNVSTESCPFYSPFLWHYNINKLSFLLYHLAVPKKRGWELIYFHPFFCHRFADVKNARKIISLLECFFPPGFTFIKFVGSF